MIIRSAVSCKTCDLIHVVRIGMGQEDHQSHRFPCRGCGEEIGVGLKVDYASISSEVLAELNCELAREAQDSPVVNLDANFLVPEELQDKDGVFPRLHQYSAMVRTALKAGVEPKPFELGNLDLELRPYRRPDYLGEWKELRKAWALFRRGQHPLSRGTVKKASDTLYAKDPLASLSDWVWRFLLHLTAPAYNLTLKNLMERAKSLSGSKDFQALVDHYCKSMINNRGVKYISILSEYFSNYSEYAQVQFLITSNQDVDPRIAVSSTDFNATRMFYGNAFEAFADLIDIIALTNNVYSGRAYDKFEQLTLKQYYQIDKAGRTNCFGSDDIFMSLAPEFDGQLRNASHHGGLTFDPSTQIITYKSGKGGQGQEKQITYTEYLIKCVRINMQIVNLLQYELLIANSRKLAGPL